MIIRAVSLKTPGLLVSNDALLSHIKASNTAQPLADVEAYCARVQAVLEKAGAKTRRIRDRAAGETAISLMTSAIRDATLKSELQLSDINLVIFCGVGRGFLEPANAAFLCQQLGLTCDFFDVADACMSWVRALHIAYSFLATPDYTNIVIVNGEFTAFEFGLPDILKLCTPAEFTYTFPALTIGEAATATVLSKSPAKWRFRFRTDAQKASLCTLPLPGYEDFCGPREHIGLNGILRLVSFGTDLTTSALKEIVHFVRQTFTAEEIAAFDLWFPHAAGTWLCDVAARQLGLGSKLYSKVFSEYGNLISASIPAALSMALEDGTLQRGSKIVFCPASAGISLALVDGVF